MTALRRVVVVGGGLAGHVAATTLRHEGYDGAITLLAEEHVLPYDRPPLSKELLTGAVDTTTLASGYDDLGVVVLTGCPAVRLGRGTVVTETGDHPYDGLILATGSAPRRLPGQPPEVFELRTHDDAVRLRYALASADSVAVVGAGWIGAEVAPVAAARGCRVTVVDTAPAPLARLFPVEVTRYLTRWYDEHGISLRLNHAVSGVDGSGVRLERGDRIDADVVVIGIGARPRTDWLRDGGVTLAPDGAVVVDSHLRAGPAGVCAAGDIVRWPSERFGEQLRIEHWDHASASGQAAARNLLGAAAPYDPVPYFWSDQFGHRLQYVGHHSPSDQLLFRGRPDIGDAWTALWLRGDQVRAVLAVDRPRDVLDARQLINQGTRVKPALAVDPELRLSEAVGVM